MSDRTERVLADIDDVITDWNGSRDSMRWSPGPPEAHEHCILRNLPSLDERDRSGAYAVRAMLRTGRAATLRTGDWAEGTHAIPADTAVAGAPYRITASGSLYEWDEGIAP